MSRGAQRIWLAVAAAAIVATFALQLALAAWNRSGETARLELTGASLSLPSPGWTDEGEPLSLRIEPLDAIEPAPGELAALGFPPARIERRQADRSLLERSAWVVLDVSDQAWRRYLADQAAQVELWREGQTGETDGDERHWRQKRLEALRQGPPHAVLVAAGGDAGQLRRELTDRTRQAVARGTMRLSRPWYHAESWTVDARLTVDDLTVPPRFHGIVRELIDEWGRRGGEDGVSVQDEPAFRALVAWGRRGEPWLVDIEPQAEERTAPTTTAPAEGRARAEPRSRRPR